MIPERNQESDPRGLKQNRATAGPHWEEPNKHDPFARNETEREVTEKQISEWIGDGHKGVFLRPNDSYEPDEVFKSELADKFEEMGGKIDLVFDDRNKVVQMWRDRGTTVVQVADGDF